MIVRVNPPGTADYVADLATLSQTDYRRIMVAKSESAKRLSKIDRRFEVIALCETAKGVAQADRIAALANVSALMWGAEDLVASLGGTSSRKPNGRYRDIARMARARVLLAAGSRGKAAIDAVHLDIADTKRLTIEAMDAAASGFTATACIHPSQVDVIRDAYRPDAKSSRGRTRCSPRPRPSAASSPTRAAWSTSRCCATRAGAEARRALTLTPLAAGVRWRDTRRVPLTRDPAERATRTRPRAASGFRWRDTRHPLPRPRRTCHPTAARSAGSLSPALRAAHRDDRVGHAPDQLVRHRLRVREHDRVLLGAVRRDLALERLGAASAPGRARCASSTPRSGARSARRA